VHVDRLAKRSRAQAAFKAGEYVKRESICMKAKNQGIDELGRLVVIVSAFLTGVMGGLLLWSPFGEFYTFERSDRIAAAADVTESAVKPRSSGRGYKAPGAQRPHYAGVR
jgi:hypothetical protein